MSVLCFPLYYSSFPSHISLQGAGTAIGELPPYFMARAARLSGQEDEEFEELEEELHSRKVSGSIVMPHAIE